MAATPTSYPTLPIQSLIDAVIDRALEEDLAGGDLTTDACVAAGARATAIFVAKTPLVVAGLSVARRVFERLDASAIRSIDTPVADGTLVAAGTQLMTLEGDARVLLMGERVSLNLVQRMSGTATLTRKLVDAIPIGARTRIVDTRKTTPGLRALERYAVRCGGGHNHRDMLGSAVLIKDNHIVAAGGITSAIERARGHAPHTSKIECEVETIEQLDEALQAGADVLLLDNMDDALTAKAVDRVREIAPKTVVESSGGITLARIATLASLGVDVISVGALTHSAPAADVSLDLRNSSP